MPSSPPGSTSSAGTISDAAAQHRIGVGNVVASQGSELAPATVLFGVVPTAVAATALIGVPIAMIAVAVVLALFVPGYLAMARHIPNAGAFYAYIARGIWRPIGVGASWLALVSYMCFTNASYGGFGTTVSSLLQSWFGINVSWWIPGLIAVALVAYLGIRRISFVGKILAVLVIAETAVVLMITVATVLAPGFHLNWTAMNPHQLWGSDGAKLFVIAVTGYVGYEAAPVYIREARDPKRTVSRATYITLVGVAALYWISSWVQISGAGSQVVDKATQQGPVLFGGLAAATLGNWTIDLSLVLFGTSVFAAAVAFQNVSARYAAVLGQEGVMARYLGRNVDEAPRNASLTLSGISLVIVVLYAVTGADPLNHLFFWGGTAGALGVLLLTVLTAVAIIGFFARDNHGESAWHRVFAPGLALITLGVTSYLALTNLDTLYGPGSDTISKYTPIVVLVIMVLGTIWGIVLRQSRPSVYAGIGLGTQAASSRAFGSVFDTDTPDADNVRVAP